MRTGPARAAAVYVAVTGLATMGGAFGLLGATGTATAAGTRTTGPLYTGAYLAVTLLAAGLATPYAPRLAARRGIRSTYVRALGANAALWLLTGTALLLGTPAMPTLLATALPIGVTSGMLVVLRPILSKAYLTAVRTSGAVARTAIVAGVAWSIGSLVGGQVLSHIALAWGLVINGALSAPFVLAVIRRTPTVEPAAPPPTGRPWRTAWSALSANRILRLSALLSAVAMLCLAPVTTLVVPIAQDLRQSPLVVGAGLLMTSFALGELCSPPLVRRLGIARHDLPAGAIAASLAGLALVALAVASAILGHRIELLAWLAIGLAFGALRFAAKALYVGAAAEAGREADAAHNLAAATLVGLLAAPFGTLACGTLIGVLSADSAVLISGVAGALAAFGLFRASRHLGPADAKG